MASNNNIRNFKCGRNWYWSYSPVSPFGEGNPDSGILEIISCGIRILGFGIRNPSSTGKESRIQCLESKIHGVESRIQDTRQPPWIPLHGATCVTVFCYPSRSSSFWDDGWKVEKILKLSAWDLKLLKLSVNLHYNQVINLFWFRSRQKVLFPAFREEWEV